MSSVEKEMGSVSLLLDCGDQLAGNGCTAALQSCLVAYGERFVGCLGPAIFSSYIRRVVDDAMDTGEGIQITTALKSDELVPDILKYARIMKSKEETMDSDVLEE